MDDDDFTEVAVFEDEADARDAATKLIESGIGSVIDQAVVVDEDTGEETTAHSLRALPINRRRAQEILGLVEARAVPMGDDEHPAKLEKGKTPWKAILLVWLIALLTIPPAAFFFTIWVLSAR